ncbi:hypothetical protein M9H77_28134 [Catharanthus roseus]|uniref:Uncharacterized protein n=1 Tax=Catharanthus roseus TaxID=4058 RepID=A0ACC0AIM0_CATRO|nr:hypothetical protein M9H77_28134 [Catharanthus roseus]
MDLRLVAVAETAEHHQVAVAEVDGEADLAHLLAMVQQDNSINLHREDDRLMRGPIPPRQTNAEERQSSPAANSPTRCSPIRQREKEPATKTALLQAVDSPGPASRAAHHERPSTHSPVTSIPFDSKAQHAQPSTQGPVDSLPTDSTTQRLHPID